MPSLNEIPVIPKSQRSDLSKQPRYMVEVKHVGKWEQWMSFHNLSAAQTEAKLCDFKIVRIIDMES